ncbi:MAG: sigma-70 family RNA polymerase sigma factor [Sedimentisphaerales bacterium]|nr:sigma-70 family RNA polymerase sigma factor [Sedimentisphaerales bacterium]
MPNSEKLLELLERLGPELHALLTRLTLRADVAEDLMQDLFIKLASSNLDKVTNLDAYARTTAINLAFDWRRRRGRAVSIDEEQFPEPVSDDAGPLTHLQADEQIQQVFAAMARLNKLQRQVFVLRYIQQQSFEEIAQQTGKTPHHVRALCSRAMARIRQFCCKKGWQ